MDFSHASIVYSGWNTGRHSFLRGRSGCNVTWEVRPVDWLALCFVKRFLEEFNGNAKPVRGVAIFSYRSSINGVMD
jgi:hypothetical protein